MPETFKTIAAWLTTSGTKILGILVSLIILSQISKWIVRWMEKFVPEKDPLQVAEAKKRAHRKEQCKLKIAEFKMIILHFSFYILH